MKAIIGRTFGALGLGAALLVTGCREASSVASAATTPAGTVVNCGEGRQAVVHPVTAGIAAQQVECVPVAGARGYTMAYAAGATAMPVVDSPEAPVRERVVYRTAPARDVYRRPTAEPAVYRTSDAEPAAYPERSSYPARSTSTDRYPAEERPQRSPRSWKKSAIIIGGAAAGGAGVGAIVGGKGGAVKGAVLGGVAGTIFDLATRNR